MVVELMNTKNNVTQLYNSFHGQWCDRNYSLPTQRGNSALHLACKLGLLDIVKTLCSFNADVSLQNKKVGRQYTPLCSS